jgi:broad specificity phosphatase PhoE
MKLTAPLYMLRHGETEWNTERRMQGTRDSQLTGLGRAQAVAMGRALARELALEDRPTIFLRSPLGRTRETSLIVGRELGLDAAEWRDDPRLAELSYGDWEGSSWQEIEVHTPGALDAWKTDPET